MGVQPVTYNSASSTANWSAGISDGSDLDINKDGKDDDKQVQITQDNAKIIINDAQAGRTDIKTTDIEKARNEGSASDARATYLVKWAGDDVKYDDDASRQAGKDKIDTENSKNAKGGAMAGATVATAVSAAGTAVCIAALCADGFSQLAFGICMLSLGATALGLTFAFDVNLSNRKSETDKAEDTDAVIDEARDLNNMNTEMMAEEMDLYTDKAGEVMDMQINSVNEKTDLQSQLKIAEAQGNSEEVKKLKEEMKGLEEDGKDIDAEAEELDVYRENLDLYNSDMQTSLGVHDSGTEVSKFLKQGKAFGILAMINGALNTATAAMAGLAAAGIFPKIAPLFPDIAGTGAAKIIFPIAGAMFAAASGRYFSIGSDELKAAEAGGTMDEHLAELYQSAESASQSNEETLGSYDKDDEDTSKALSEAEQKAKEALSKQKVPGPEGEEKPEEKKTSQKILEMMNA